MSLVVRHKCTGCYLRAHGVWTHELESAMQFNSGLKLVDYLEHGGVKEKPDQIEVVVFSAPRNGPASSGNSPLHLESPFTSS